MESTKNKTIQFYENIVLNPQLLSQGHHLILKFLQQQGNRQQTLLNLMHPTVPILTLVQSTYANDIFSQISPQQKQQTRKYLLRNLFEYQKDLNKIQNLLNFINRIHQIQGYESWVQLYLELLISSSQDFRTYWLIRIMRNSDDRICCLGKHIFSLCMQDKIGLRSQQQSIQIIYYCTRSMMHLVGTDDQVIEQFLNPYIEKLLNILATKCKQSMKMMKFSLKILTVWFGQLQIELTKNYKIFIEQLGLGLASQYLKTISMNVDIKGLTEEQQMDDESQQPSLCLILYQYLELCETLMDRIDWKITIWLAATSTLIQPASYKLWMSDEDQYVADCEDEGQRTLRNKGIELMLTMLQDSAESKKAKDYLIHYISSIMKASLSNSNSIQQFCISNGLPYSQLPIYLHEESAYFIMYSFTDEILYSKEMKTQALQTLVQRISTVQCKLTKIMGLIVFNKIIKSITGVPAISDSAYLQLLIKVWRTDINSIGLLLAVSRGIGYLTFKINLEIDNHIPKDLIFTILSFVTNSNHLLSVDCSHIVLQLLVRLSKLNIQNQNYLSGCISLAQWGILMGAYMHDGMTSALVAQLIGLLGSNSVVQSIWNLVKSGSGKVAEQLYEIVSVWVRKGRILIRDQQLQQLILNNYHRDYLHRIVGQYLKLPQISLSNECIEVLNCYCHESWWVSMLKLNILKNPQKVFLSSVTKIANEIISPSELQNNLVLPFYIILQNPQEAIRMLKELKSDIYVGFCEKVIKYAKLFRGDCLKVITGWFLIALAITDRRWKQKAIEVIEGYGTLENQEWEDQQEQDQQEGVIERIIGARIINQQVEETLKFNFPEKVWNSQGLKIQLEKLKCM